MFVDIDYRTTERIEIDDKYKSLITEDNAELRYELEDELYDTIGLASLSITEVNLLSCYAVDVDGADGCLFEY